MLPRLYVARFKLGNLISPLPGRNQGDTELSPPLARRRGTGPTGQIAVGGDRA
jgi:hypothetical protein